MYKEIVAAGFFSFGLALAFSSASCGPTCPKGQQSCGNSNSSADSSSAGATASGAASCEYLTAWRSCMDTFCKTASNPFCKCYRQQLHRDLTTTDCSCIDFDEQKFCADAELKQLDASDYDCAADSSRISSYCVPVQ